MAIKKFQTGVLAGAALATVVLSGRQAQAAVVYSTGFGTTEGFANGNLVGQTGGTPARTFNQALTTASDVTAAVNNGVVQITGTNLSSNNNAGGGDAGSFFPSLTLGSVNTTATPVVIVQTDLSVTNSTPLLTPGFGFSVFGGTAPSQTPIFSLYELGDGTIDYVGNGAAVNPSTPVLTLGATNTFAVALNFLTGNFAITLNSSPFATGTFNNTVGFDTVGLSGGTFDSTAGSTGVGTFDNFSISAVPEPTTASVVLGGLAVASLRRRRRAVAR